MGWVVVWGQNMTKNDYFDLFTAQKGKMNINFFTFFPFVSVCLLLIQRYCLVKDKSVKLNSY